VVYHISAPGELKRKRGVGNFLLDPHRLGCGCAASVSNRHCCQNYLNKAMRHKRTQAGGKKLLRNTLHKLLSSITSSPCECLGPWAGYYASFVEFRDIAIHTQAGNRTFLLCTKSDLHHHKRNPVKTPMMVTPIMSHAQELLRCFQASQGVV
jgi:hypothetical protein